MSRHGLRRIPASGELADIRVGRNAFAIFFQEPTPLALKVKGTPENKLVVSC
jgi:hypothetical protein